MYIQDIERSQCIQFVQWLLVIVHTVDTSTYTTDSVQDHHCLQYILYTQHGLDICLLLLLNGGFCLLNKCPESTKYSVGDIVWSCPVLDFCWML